MEYRQFKISPVAHGNHNNVWFNAQIKGIITVKAVGLYDTGEVYVTSLTPAGGVNPMLFNENGIHSMLSDKFLNSFDMVLKTSPKDILTNRSKDQQKDFVQKLYKTVN